MPDLQAYLERYSSLLDPIAIDQVKNLQAKLDKCIFTIATLGLSSRGKTSVLNALQGQKKWLTSPLYGTTKELAIGTNFQDYPDSSKVQIHLIDTPGLDTTNAEFTKIAIAAAHQADLVLFITAGDLTQLEINLINELQAATKPILLVCNKADLLDDGDRQAVLASLQTLKLPAANIIFTTADPLPRPVRLTFGQTSQEIWEPQAIQIHDLRHRLLDLLNSDRQALMSQNAQMALALIHQKWLGDRLQKLPAPRTLASGLFLLKTLLVIAVPSLAIVSSLLVESITLFAFARQFSYKPRAKLIFTGLLSAIVVANLPNHYAQILWLGWFTTLFMDWLWQDLQTI